MKRHWYDHLWVVSLTYLILGFFNILFAWLGLLVLLHPADHLRCRAEPRATATATAAEGQLFGLLGGRFGLSRREGHPKLDEKQGVPIRISGLLSLPCSF